LRSRTLRTDHFSSFALPDVWFFARGCRILVGYVRSPRSVVPHAFRTFCDSDLRFADFILHYRSLHSPFATHTVLSRLFYWSCGFALSFTYCALVYVSHFVGSAVATFAWFFYQRAAHAPTHASDWVAHLLTARLFLIPAVHIPGTCGFESLLPHPLHAVRYLRADLSMLPSFSDPARARASFLVLSVWGSAAFSSPRSFWLFVGLRVFSLHVPLPGSRAYFLCVFVARVCCISPDLVLFLGFMVTRTPFQRLRISSRTCMPHSRSFRCHTACRHPRLIFTSRHAHRSFGCATARHTVYRFTGFV